MEGLDVLIPRGGSLLNKSSHTNLEPTTGILCPHSSKNKVLKLIKSIYRRSEQTRNKLSFMACIGSGPRQKDPISELWDDTLLPKRNLIRELHDDSIGLQKKNLIGKLPDDILLNILSLLPVKDAVRTSVLSKRWRHVWAYLPVLNFERDAREIRGTLREGQWCSESRAKERKMFYWIDKAVNSHKAPTIDEFRVDLYVPMYETVTEYVDHWIKFVMEKKVQRLDMQLGSSCGEYTFPSVSFSKSLTSLHLSHANITGEVVQRCLYNCRALESLSIRYSRSLVDLKVVGSSLNLKHLEIYSCMWIKRIEISAPNLTSFYYSGRVVSLSLEGTPKLAELSIGGSYCMHDVMNSSSDLSSYISQLEALTVILRGCHMCVWQAVQFPAFGRLQNLVMQVSHYAYDVFPWDSLINACPLLHKFELYFISNFPNETRQLRKWNSCPHYNLKIVEIRGFVGTSRDFELAINLLENAVFLEKIIVELDERYNARKEAERIRAKVKPGTELVIL